MIPNLILLFIYYPSVLEFSLGRLRWSPAIIAIRRQIGENAIEIFVVSDLVYASKTLS
jgi:hypothetical protein